MKDNINKITINVSNSSRVAEELLDCFKIFDKKTKKNILDPKYGHLEIIVKGNTE